MTRRGLIATVGAVAVATAVMSLPAVAWAAPPTTGALSGLHAVAVPTEIVNDAIGDVANSHGDIVRAGAGTDASGYAFSVHVQSPTDPRVDLNWRIRPTQIQWSLATNLDGSADAVADMTADGAGNLHAVLERFPDQFVYCTGRAFFTATHDYLATFPAGCIPGLKRFRWSTKTS